MFNCKGDLLISGWRLSAILAHDFFVKVGYESLIRRLLGRPY